MGKTWWLSISYDEKTDEFFAYVDDGVKSGVNLYQIDNTDEIVDLIQTGVMKHIDDVDGLKAFLIAQEFMAEQDTIKLNEILIW